MQGIFPTDTIAPPPLVVIPPIPPDAEFVLEHEPNGDIRLTRRSPQMSRRMAMFILVLTAIGFVVLVLLLLRAETKVERVILSAILTVFAGLCLWALSMFSSPSACGVQDGTFWSFQSDRIGRRHRECPVADVLAVDVSGGAVRILYTAQSGRWECFHVRLAEQYEVNRWMAGVLARRTVAKPMINEFAAPEPLRDGSVLEYSFGMPRPAAERIPRHTPAAEDVLRRTELADGGAEYVIPREPFFQRSMLGSAAAVLVTTVVASSDFPMVIRIMAGFVATVVVWATIDSRWHNRTRVTLRLLTDRVELERRSPARKRVTTLRAEDFVSLWREPGELRGIRPDRTSVRLLTREREEVLDVIAELICQRLSLGPIARTEDARSQPAKMGRVAAPAPGETPTGSRLILEPREDGNWKLRLPPRRTLLWVPAIVAALMLALTIFMAMARVGMGAVGFIALIWILAILWVRRYISEGLFETTLEFNGSNLIFSMPTLFGVVRAASDHWAIAGLRVSPNLGASSPRAALHLDLRGAQSVPLFDLLPEQEARWVASLIAHSLKMTVPG